MNTTAGETTKRKVRTNFDRRTDYTQADVQAARKLRSENKSYREIARALDIPLATIAFWLKGETFEPAKPFDWKAQPESEPAMDWSSA